MRNDPNKFKWGFYCFWLWQSCQCGLLCLFSFSSFSSLSFSSSLPSYLFSLIVRKNRSWLFPHSNIWSVCFSQAMFIAWLSYLKHHAGHRIQIRKIFPSWHFLSSGALDKQIDNYRYYNRTDLVISWIHM